MPHKSLCLVALTCLSCTSLLAQDKDARKRLIAAHAQYYTPTASGLKSFQCEASIDWKTMLTRASGIEIRDDNPALQFLQTVHLAVADDLHGRGSLDWSSPTEPPENKKATIKEIQDGLQTSVSGFFQSWNAYMNGSMVPLPDSTVNVTTSGDGVHLSGISKDTTFDEDYDKNTLLTQVQVVTPNLKVLAKPTYTSTGDGLLVSAVSSQVHQPPTAPEMDVTFRIEYAKVDSYQIPSHVVFDIKNTGLIEIGFKDCKVTVADWAKKN
jgi:hypothetical protein